MSNARIPGWDRVYRPTSAEELAKRVAQAKAQGQAAIRRAPQMCCGCHGAMPKGNHALFCPRCIGVQG
jgi:hypothetical protein